MVTTSNSIVKRAVDIIVSAVLLVVLSPLLLLIALWVRLDSPGSALFRGSRVGKDGKPFHILKFRTMVVGAASNGPKITAGGDSRVTRSGRILRATKLDELPQLVNVLRGEMSLVGPRPEDPAYVALYTPAQQRVLTVRPGITGLASVQYRNEEVLLAQGDPHQMYVTTILPRKLSIELSYIDNWSLWLDLRILVLTVGVLFVPDRGKSEPARTAPGKSAGTADPREPTQTGQCAPSGGRTTGNAPVIRIRYVLPLDALCIALAFVSSFIIRFELVQDAWLNLLQCTNLLALSMVVRLPAYAFFGLYNCLWRYAGIKEVRRMLAAAFTSSVLVIVGNAYVLPLLGLANCSSRSILVLDGLANLACLSTSRLLLRLFQENRLRRDRTQTASPSSGSRRVLIVGAGDAGEMLVREMQNNPGLGLVPVGFVDDTPDHFTMRIHGIPVLGSVWSIPTLAARQPIDEVIFALPMASGSTVRSVKEICATAGLPFRTIPSLNELLDGKVSVKQLRQVRIEDLLRREQVVTDQTGVRAYVHGARVLVTGAGGSIGSEICRQVARHEPEELLLLGHGENSIFNIERELRARFPQVPVRAVIADIRDAERINRIIGRYRPAVIFHAAAHKHVPLMQSNVEEAFENNVLGTRSVLRAAERNGVERFVLISTDKAVHPTSFMGTTKRVAELLVQDTARRAGRPYVAVRFGNVLGSRGSAVPIFQEQIAAGGPVTITHPDMHRYFMTIPEAVQLVLQAAALGSGGEVFVLDMGEPVKILDLVRDLIELSGLTPGEDIEIVYTGLRPGEKLYEELSLAGEECAPTRHEKITVIRNGVRDEAKGERLERRITMAGELAAQMDTSGLIAQLRYLVPELELGTPAQAPGSRPASGPEPAPASAPREVEPVPVS